jgi:N-acetylglucosamine kinase-like BadF-type ATPase
LRHEAFTVHRTAGPEPCRGDMNVTTLSSGRTIIAIDGGGSKTDAVLIRDDGIVLARARAGPFIPHLVGADAAVESLSDAITALLRHTEGVKVDLIVAYLANADLVIDEERLHAAFTSHHWADRVVVDNDTLALLRTGTSVPYGVAIVCGAGINAVGVGMDGSRVRYPALGRITGDWGGGLSLSKDVLWSTSRCEDGRGPHTSLARAVAEHFGYPTALNVALAMHSRDIDFDRMHEIVPLLVTAAEEGDDVAQKIVARQAEEIVLLAITTLRRLDLLEAPVQVVLGGGILGAERSIITTPVREGILASAPQAAIVVSTEIPLIGAALLGMERLWGDQVSAAGLEAVRKNLRLFLAPVIP